MNPEISLDSLGRVLLSQLTPHSSNFSVTVKVICQKVIIEKRRKDGTSARVAEYLVGDESGMMLLRLIHQHQAETIIPGNTLHISHADVDLVEGYLRLQLTRWAVITIAADPISQKLRVDESTDWSLIEYGFF